MAPDGSALSGIAAQLLMMALSGAVGWLGGKIKGAAKERREQRERTDEERDAMRSSMRLLLFYRLKDLFEEYVVRGAEITSADKHEIEELYEIYHGEYSGNGEGTRMYRELMDLKTEQKEV